MAANAEGAVSRGALRYTKMGWILSQISRADLTDFRRIVEGEHIQEPVFQCVQVKPMTQNANGAERYRLVWSDVDNFIQSMLATRESASGALEEVSG